MNPQFESVSSATMCWGHLFCLLAHHAISSLLIWLTSASQVVCFCALSSMSGRGMKIAAVVTMLVQFGGPFATLGMQMTSIYLLACRQFACAAKVLSHQSRNCRVSWSARALLFATFVLSQRTRAARGSSLTDCHNVSSTHRVNFIIDEARDDARLHICLPSRCAPRQLTIPLLFVRSCRHRRIKAHIDFWLAAK